MSLAPDKVNYATVTWDQLHRDARSLAMELMKLPPIRGIVAISRGGLIPAAIVARELECRLVETISVASYEGEAGTQTDPVLLKAPAAAGDGTGFVIIDDLVDSGVTAALVRSLLPKASFACLYAKPAGRAFADLIVAEVPQDTWILFPWDTAPLFVPPLARSTKVPDIAFQKAPATLPPETRVYAIGDVHGCFDALTALHRQIATDLGARPVAKSLLIHLGDYIDRGEDSFGVVERLSGEIPVPVTLRFDLMGNHEMLMLDALRGRSRRDAAMWLQNGGLETLASYGLDADTTPAEWRARVPEQHRLWLVQRDLSHAVGGYLFVHAGIRPGLPIEVQTPEDMLWIREPFLSDDEQHGAVVVHGHTPSADPVIRSNRIGIDTGAALGGRLTCLVLEDDRLGFLSA